MTRLRLRARLLEPTSSFANGAVLSPMLEPLAATAASLSSQNNDETSKLVGVRKLLTFAAARGLVEIETR